MRKSDEPLQRLFRAAASAHREAGVPSVALQNRVLAELRTAAAADEFDLLANLLRRAVMFAGVIMVLSIGVSWMQSRSEKDRGTALANYAMEMELPP